MAKKIRVRGPKRGRRISSPATPEHVNYDRLCPIFSLRYLVPSHGIAGQSDDVKAAILDAFHVRSQSTWADLKSSGRHQHGCEKIEQTALRVPLPTNVTPDQTILSFRCVGMKPMVGFREEDRFHILWFDLNRDVYDHGS